MYLYSQNLATMVTSKGYLGKGCMNTQGWNLYNRICCFNQTANLWCLTQV